MRSKDDDQQFQSLEKEWGERAQKVLELLQNSLLITLLLSVNHNKQTALHLCASNDLDRTADLLLSVAEVVDQINLDQLHPQNDFISGLVRQRPDLSSFGQQASKSKIDERAHDPSDGGDDGDGNSRDKTVTRILLTTRDRFGYLPLHEAVFFHNIRFLRVITAAYGVGATDGTTEGIIDEDYSINAKTGCFPNSTALHLAAQRDDLEVVDLLVDECNASITITDSDNNTPFLVSPLGSSSWAYLRGLIKSSSIHLSIRSLSLFLFLLIDSDSNVVMFRSDPDRVHSFKEFCCVSRGVEGSTAAKDPANVWIGGHSFHLSKRSRIRRYCAFQHSS